VQIQSSVVPKKNEKPKEEMWISRLISRGNESRLVSRKSNETEHAKAESIQKSKPPATADTATNQAIAEASLSTNSHTAAAKKTPQTKTPRWMSYFTKYQTLLIISTSLVWLIIGLYGKYRRKAHRREVATEAATEAPATGSDGLGKPPPLPDISHDFAGSIASMSLGSVAQFLNSDNKTGTLLVKDKSHAEIGTLVFIKGQLIDAKSPDKRGTNAFYKILRNKEGFFSFLCEEPKNVEQTIMQDIISLLLNAHQIMDEELTPPVQESLVTPTAACDANTSHQATPKTATKLKLHGNR
jgi:hypothetical protein